jgi:hypothetical protein
MGCPVLPPKPPATETAEAATVASWAEEDRAEGRWR